MSCHSRTKAKIMQSVRRKHPNYSLKRRKKIVNAIVYNRKRNKFESDFHEVYGIK